MSLGAYRTIQPFGQIPALQDGATTLFESGAIVLHVAERSRALLPVEQPARAHVMQWMFAALKTLELPIMELAGVDLFHAELAPRLEGRDYLAGPFSAADVLMASVLQILRHTDLLAEQPRLAAYVARCEARPAYERALSGQPSAFAAWRLTRPACSADVRSAACAV